MAIWDSVKKGLELAQLCSTALELIHKIWKDHKGKKPEDLLDLIGSIVTNVQSAINGEKSAKAAQADLEKIQRDIAANNATIDKEIDEEFDKG